MIRGPDMKESAPVGQKDPEPRILKKGNGVEAFSSLYLLNKENKIVR
jgi:hypothetical protein